MNWRDWRQQGHAYLWRYDSARARHAGWHFTADPQACASLSELLQAMRVAGDVSQRTVRLETPPAEIQSVPGMGMAKRESIETLRLAYNPAFDDLVLQFEDQRLVLQVGDKRINELKLALAEVAVGGGDFTLSPASCSAPSLWFWWMPWSMGLYSSQG